MPETTSKASHTKPDFLNPASRKIAKEGYRAVRGYCEKHEDSGHASAITAYVGFKVRICIFLPDYGGILQKEVYTHTHTDHPAKDLHRYIRGFIPPRSCSKRRPKK